MEDKQLRNKINRIRDALKIITREINLIYNENAEREENLKPSHNNNFTAHPDSPKVCQHKKFSQYGNDMYCDGCGIKRKEILLDIVDKSS